MEKFDVNKMLLMTSNDPRLDYKFDGRILHDLGGSESQVLWLCVVVRCPLGVNLQGGWPHDAGDGGR